MLVKRTLIFIFICTIIFSQDAEKLCNQAESQLLSGDLDNAELSFNASLQLDQTYAPALKGLSKLYLYKGNIKKASTYAKNATTSDNDFRPWSDQILKLGTDMGSGKSNTDKRLYNEAIRVYESIIKEHPYYSDAYFYLGYNHYKNGDIDSASKNFVKAREIYSDHKNAGVMLGNITKKFLNEGNKAYKNRDIGTAKEKYLTALKYDPNFAKSYYQLGVIEKASGNTKLAEEYLEKAKELNPENHKIWFVLGNVCEIDRKIDRAIENYKKAIELKYDYSKAYGNLGKLLYQEKQEFKEAERVLKEVTQFDNKYANGFMHLGMVYKTQALSIKKQIDNGNLPEEKIKAVKSNYLKAIDYLSKSVELDSSNYENFNHLAESYFSVENWNKVIFVAKKSVDIKNSEKQNGTAYYYWAVAELNKSKGNKSGRSRALNLFEKAKSDKKWRKAAEKNIYDIKNPK